MKKIISILILFSFLSPASKSQTNAQAEKAGRISSGMGFAGAAKNTQSVGRYVWLQLDYKFSKNISIATEFENMTYQLPGYYTALPASLNKINAVDK